MNTEKDDECSDTLNDFDLIVRYAFDEIFDQNKKKILQEKIAGSRSLQNELRVIKGLMEMNNLDSPEQYKFHINKQKNALL